MWGKVRIWKVPDIKYEIWGVEGSLGANDVEEILSVLSRRESLMSYSVLTAVDSHFIIVSGKFL